MEKRLDATFGGVRTVQPTLVKFYDGLTDEQKARFNSLRSASRPVGRASNDRNGPAVRYGCNRS
jgi:hypothetical protein